MNYLEGLGVAAKSAAAGLYELTEEKINACLIAAADALTDSAEQIKSENAKDIENARVKGLSAAFIDRLKVTDGVIEAMATSLKQLAKLESPIGKTVYEHENAEQGIKIVKKAVPFGVVGIIFESRPNVTADAFGLCFKTRNAVILRGGSDAFLSNRAIVKAIRTALDGQGIDQNAVSLIEDLSRETATAFMKLNKYVDLLIPRGGASLIKTAVENATVPMISSANR